MHGQPREHQRPPASLCPFKQPGSLPMRRFMFVCNDSSYRGFTAIKAAKRRLMVGNNALMVGNSSQGFSRRVVYYTGCKLGPLILCSGTDFSETMSNLFYL